MKFLSGVGNRGATPVVGVILIVAITIILGAVFAAFALDIGENVQESAPAGSFDYTYSDKNNKVIVTYNSGDTLRGNRLRFEGAATEKTSFGSITEWTGGAVKAGDTATVEVKSDETLHVIWQANGSKNTARLSKYDVPTDPPATASIGSVDTDNTAQTSAGGEVCAYNVQFNNAWGDSVYVVADNLDDPTEDSALLTTSGEDVLLELGGGSVSNGDTIEVVVYENKDENNQLDSVTSQAGAGTPPCSI